jgi:hypothetical protein
MEGFGEHSEAIAKTMIKEVLTPALVDEYFQFLRKGAVPVADATKCDESQENSASDTPPHPPIQS